jgi:hypothetical protein
MTLVTDALKKAGLITTQAAAPEPEPEQTCVPKIDGRKLLRGVPKPKPKGVKLSAEGKQVLKLLQSAKPTQLIIWAWHTGLTYQSFSLRNKQIQCAYRVAATFGYKISISSTPKHLRILVLEIAD